MSDVTTAVKTFRAERQLRIKYRVLGQQTGSYMVCITGVYGFGCFKE